MQKVNLGIDPATWLAAAPNGLTPGKVSEVLNSFGSVPTVYRFTGPGELLRGTGKDGKGRQALAYGGGYWVDGAVLGKIDAKLAYFTGWLTEKELAAMKKGRYRSGSAVCDDWNDFAEFHKMVVPAGETFDGVAGPIKEQPLNSGMSPAARDTPMLKGGFEQIYIKVRNPFWIYETVPF